MYTISLKRLGVIFTISVFLFLSFLYERRDDSTIFSEKGTRERSAPDREKIARAMREIGVPFVENRGQKNGAVKFYANLEIGTLFVTKKGELVYSLRGTDGKWNVIREKLPLVTNPLGGRVSSTRVSVFVKGGRFVDLTSYDTVRLPGIARNVNLILKAYGGKVEKIFEVLPGGDPADIFVRVEGARRLYIKDERLHIVTSSGDYKFSKPVFYQERDGRRVKVQGYFRLLGDDVYGFRVDDYDRSSSLYIDPVMYGTFLGGGRDCGRCEEYCGSDVGGTIVKYGGYVYISGRTGGDFPTTLSAYQYEYGGGDYDVFVSKMSADLSKLVASTYIGGSQSDYVGRMYVTSSGVYLDGWTNSSDFPVTGTGCTHGDDDVFVVRLDLDLTSLQNSVCLGGTRDDRGLALYVTTDSVYLTGLSWSEDYPVSYGAYDTDNSDYMPDAFVTRLSLDLSRIIASTFLGGGSTDSGSAISVNQYGVFVAGSTLSYGFPTTPGSYRDSSAGGEEGFVARLDPGLTTLLGSTYIGGGNDDYILGLYLGDDGVFIAGYTQSSNFPTTDGAYQTTSPDSFNAFVARFDFKLGSLEASTLLGGSSWDKAQDLYVTEDGVYVVGWTQSNNFPVTPNAFDTDFNTWRSVFVSKLDSNLSDLLYSTYIGSTGNPQLSVFVSGEDVYITGYTQSSSFPVTAEAYDSTLAVGNGDIFVSRLSLDLGTLKGSTFLGGGGEREEITSFYVTDDAVYVAGWTLSSGFPTTFDAYDVLANGSYDAFVSKLSPDLSSLIASTYIGGSGEEGVETIKVTDDDVYIGGWTNSSDFPVSYGAYDTETNGSYDAFIGKFSKDLSELRASTLLGGEYDDWIQSMEIGSDGIYVGGWTGSSDFPTTYGSYDTDENGSYDAIVCKLNMDLSELLASTFLGGSGMEGIQSIYLANDGIYVGGRTDSPDFPVAYGAYDTEPNGSYDIFVGKLSFDLASLLAATYLGGSEYDSLESIFVTDDGVFLGGFTYSSNFPTTYGSYDTEGAGFGDGIIGRFTPDLKSLLSATYLGGTWGDGVEEIFVTDDGVYAAGWTESPDFPTTYGAFNTASNGGYDMFISKFAVDLSSLEVSTYLGSENGDQANSIFVTTAGVYIVGEVDSCEFPVNGYDEIASGCQDGIIIFFSADYFGGQLSGYQPVIESFTVSPDSGDTPLTVQLSVVASDPDGSVVRYFWDCDGDGSYEGVSTGASYQCDFYSARAWHPRVKVVDDEGNVSVATATVIVRGNLAPVINSFVASPSSGSAPLNSVLTVDATDPDGSIGNYLWDCDGDGVYEGSSSSNTHQCSYTTSGVYHPVVKVVDNDNASVKRSIPVEVSPGSGNLPPEITSFSADPSSGTAPLSVTFTVVASDPDGNIVNYRWDFNGDGVWDKEGMITETTYTYDTPGTYTVSVEVEDDGGAVVRDSLDVEVLAGSGGGTEDNTGDNTSGENVGASVSGEESTGCGCNVGNGNNQWGDLLLMLLWIALWIPLRRRFEGLGDNRR